MGGWVGVGVKPVDGEVFFICWSKHTLKINIAKLIDGLIGSWIDILKDRLFRLIVF